jgi:hypothetical protein
MQSDHISIHFLNVASYASSVLTSMCNTHTHLYSTRKTRQVDMHVLLTDELNRVNSVRKAYSMFLLVV